MQHSVSSIHNLKFRCPVQLRWLDVGLLIILSSVMLSLAWIYVTQEQIFYYWDYAAYQGMTQRLLAQSASVGQLARTIVTSLGSEYNYLFSLPLLVWEIAFPSSRAGFIIGLTISYQIPFVLTLGALAASIVKRQRRQVFWITAWVAALTPMAWAPVLRGFPDVSAAWMIALAMLLYLSDPSLKRWRAKLGIGLVLTLAMLLRRHFVYDVAAFFIALGLNELAQLIALKTTRLADLWPPFKQAAGRILQTVLAILGWMVLLAIPFVRKILSQDYSLLYTSYTTSILTTGISYLTYFGWQTWGLSAAGYLTGASSRWFDQTRVRFMALYMLTSLSVWILWIRISATHYTLHFSSAMIIGLALLIVLVWQQPHQLAHKLALLGIALWLGLNGLMGLTSLGGADNWKFGFSQSYPPLVRSDYQQVADLVSYLRQEIPSQAPIYVAASSVKLNDDLLRNAERRLFTSQELNFLAVPHIDSRDQYPLEMLLQAQWVIVATPFQHSLHDPNEQKVISSVVTLFTQAWELSADFERQSRSWQLKPGITVTLYRRIHPTSPSVAIRTYGQLSEYIGRRPVQQPDWLALQPDSPRLITVAEQHYQAALTPQASPTDWWYLYTRPMPAATDLQSAWSYERGACPPISAALILFDAQGRQLQSYPVFTAENGQTGNFNPLPQLPAADILALQVSSPAADSETDPCNLYLDWTFSP